MKLRDFVDVSQAQSKDVFERRLVDFAQQWDFGIISGSVVNDRPGRPAQFFPLGNTPEGFAEKHMSVEDSGRDPVLKRLKARSTPFSYDLQTYVDADATDLWEIQASHGYRTGITTASHLPNGKHFILGVDREKRLPQREHLTKLMADLQLLVAYAQEAALHLYLPREKTEDVPCPLSRRELQCLQWTLEGKSMWDIGGILSISHNTVGVYIRSINRKLGCANKIASCTKAVRLGWVR